MGCSKYKQEIFNINKKGALAETMWQNIEALFSGLYIPHIGLMDIAEMALIVYVLYKFIVSVKDTRTMLLIKAIFILLGIYFVAELLNFNVITVIFQSLALIAIVAAIIIFQPELRKTLERLGSADYHPVKKFFKRKNGGASLRYSNKTLDEICDAAFALSSTKTGALIVAEQDIPLNDYIDTGISLNADVSSALLINIFEKNTPLHDGAIIVVNNKVVAGTCYLPLSDNPKISKHLGTRHRAALGVSETTDCFVVVVSEETGRVSYVENGKIMVCKNKEDLYAKLKARQIKKETKEKNFNLKHNLLIKVAALFTGVAVWFFAMNSIDPVITRTIYDVPITVINEQVLEDAGKTYEIISAKTATVIVTDVRSIAENLTKDDISVVADLSKLSYVNSVPLSANAKNTTTTVEFVRDNTLTVSLDNIVTKEFALSFDKVGEAAIGYFVSKITSPTQGIVVTGAEKLINTIDRVEFTVDVSGAKDNFSKTVSPVIYDKNGSVLDIKQFVLSKKSILVQAELLNTKEIPLNITLATPEEDALYTLSINSYNPTTIRIAASDDVLNDISELNIEVKTDIASAELTQATFVKEINVNDYLPSGVFCASNTNKINILINYEPFMRKALTFSINDILVEGQRNGHQVVLARNAFQVEVMGPAEIIATLEITDLIPYIDVTNLPVGTHSLPLQYKNLDGIIMLSETNVDFTIEKSEK